MARRNQTSAGKLLALGLSLQIWGCGAAPEKESFRTLAGFNDPTKSGDAEANGEGDGESKGAISSDAEIACNPSETRFAPARIWRLTNAQYDNLARDLLGDTSRPARAFALEPDVHGFSNNAEVLTVPQLIAEQYRTAAEALAATAVAKGTAFTGCDIGTDTCMEQFIRKFGRQAFRRPVTDDQADRLLDLYQLGKAKSAANGLILVVEAILQSPYFIYRTELGDLNQVADGKVPLTAHEVAAQLSFYLWNTQPDDALAQAADDGSILKKDELRKQLVRMKADAKARSLPSRFYEQALMLDRLETTSKDAAKFPTFAAAKSSLLQETTAFVEHVVWDGEGTLEAIMTAPYSFVNAPLAAIYGLPGIAGNELRQVELNKNQRAGILTQPAVLAAYSNAVSTSPIARGKFIREQILCQDLTPPPANVEAMLKPPQPTLTTRERYSEHSSNPACSGCHKLIDGIGFGYENYDAAGVYRELENGKTIDASGEVVALDRATAKFEGALALGRILADSPQVSKCTVKQFFRFSQGRSDAPADGCHLSDIHGKFSAAGGNLRTLVDAIVEAEAFLYRRR